MQREADPLGNVLLSLLQRVTRSKSTDHAKLCNCEPLTCEVGALTM